MRVVSRIADQKESIRSIAQKADGLADCVRFDLGQPDFDTPEHIKAAAIAAIQEGKTGYAPVRGIEPLREAIAKYEARKGLDVTKDQVLVTAGAMEALFIALVGLLNPREKVLANDPHYGPYGAIAATANVILTTKPFFRDDKLVLDALPVDAKTRAIIVNSPENPTGRVYSETELRKLARFAVEHDLLILSDEVYDQLVYEGEHASIAAFAPKHTVLVNSVSKSFAMTGWRIGWLVAPPPVVDGLAKVHRAVCSCVGTPNQYAALKALTAGKQATRDMVAEYKRRRDAACRRLDRLGWPYAKPQGAFYVFADIGSDGAGFCDQLLEKEGVALIPGEAFGPAGKTCVRLCFGTTAVERIEEGFDRIERFVKAQKK